MALPLLLLLLPLLIVLAVRIKETSRVSILYSSYREG
jgi:lipopolysaccharide/colanic/teichoic acid biosynthesis glycosyltransferase